MSITYKGPTGWLYRASERPDAKGEYHIEYLDPATSAVYKPLPGYNGSADRAEIANRLANDRSLEVVEDTPSVAAPEKPKSPGVWLYGDHRAMRVGVGNDTDRSDCRYYHVLVLNLLADKPCWRKLSGAGNYDCKHLADANEELRETLPEDARELTMTEAGRLFTSPSTGFFELKPNAVKAWDEIMATASAAALEPTSSPASAEPPSVEPAALTAPPAADIAAPAFDYTQVDTDTANLLRELESGIAENQKTAVQVASAIGEKLQRGHDYLAKKGYGCYGEWCESLGYNRTQAKRLTDLHNFVCNTMLQTERDAIEALPLTVAYQVANPNMPEEVKEAARNGDISTLKELEALRAQLKATEQAKAEAERRAHNLENQNQSLLHSYESEKGKTEKAEREKREALAWKQHAEGQAEDAKAAIHAAQQTAQEAQRQARQAEAKVEHQESMLAELQDRLDEATGQLRAGVGTVTAEMVDQDELERRAQELADQKIAEALNTQERQPLCDLVITLNNAIKSAWSLSGIEDRDPESEDDDTSLEVLYETLYYLTDWVEERLAPDVYEQEEAIAT